MAKKRGRKPLSAGEHKARGTYRRDRHGDRKPETRMKTEEKKPTADRTENGDDRGFIPAGLSKAMAKLWVVVLRDLILEPTEEHLLELALRAYDRGEQARAAVDRDGPVFNDKFGQPKPHPGISIEHSSRLDFAKLLREAGVLVDGPRSYRNDDEKTDYEELLEELRGT